MGASLQEMVEAYTREPAPGLRNAIIARSMPLVKSIVGKISRPNHPLSGDDDLESAGILGLLQALDSYDATKKVQFNTFAYYRIRGSIIDYLRKIDEVPRVQRANIGKAQEVMQQLSQKLGREPEDEEVAEELEISVEDYQHMLTQVQQRAILSLDDQKFDNEGGGESLAGYIEDPDAKAPDEDIDRKGTADIIKQKMQNLKERDRLILALYYYEDLTLSEIALLLGLTEARISQILGKLLLWLKSELGDSRTV